MPDLRIRRSHSLGLDEARRVARAWADDVKRDFQLECTFSSSPQGEQVAFERTAIPRVTGTLSVTGGEFNLHAKLGALAGAFASTIRSRIEERLDEIVQSVRARTDAPPNDSDETRVAVVKADMRTDMAAAVDVPQPQSPPETTALARKSPPKRAAATKAATKAAPVKAAARAPGAKAVAPKPAKGAAVKSRRV